MSSRPLFAAILILVLLGLAPAALAAPSSVTHAVMNFRSQPGRDGFLQETCEACNTADFINSGSEFFYLGDLWADRQFRSILSFGTGGLPDNATITRVVLKIKAQGYVGGTDPFTTHGNVIIDIRKGGFGFVPALSTDDFNAPRDAKAGEIPNTPVSGWYHRALYGSAFPYINLTGLTQFRLRFSLDDNDDGADDYRVFYSGDWHTAADRPFLRVEYDVP